MKKLISLLGLLLILSPIFAQIDDDPQLFGSSRGGDVYALKNLKEISGTDANFTFTIKNSDSYDMTICSVNIPEGTSVLIPNKTFIPKEEGKIIVTVYKEYLNADDKGLFSKKIIVTVNEKTINGVIITKDFTLLLTGKFVE
ncbi:MAG: hypothetical protein U9Q83_01480 [Bacteroidota bacterium]|nr:hypothetical protein [Bacteroidota bacterium]